MTLSWAVSHQSWVVKGTFALRDLAEAFKQNRCKKPDTMVLNELICKRNCSGEILTLKCHILMTGIC